MILGEKGQGQWVSSENIDQVAYHNFSGRHFRYRSAPSEELALLLKTVLESPEKKEQYAGFAYDYIHQYMDAEIGAELLVDVYQKTIQKKTSKGDFFKWYLKAVFHKILGIRQILRK